MVNYKPASMCFLIETHLLALLLLIDHRRRLGGCLVHHQDSVVGFCSVEKYVSLEVYIINFMYTELHIILGILGPVVVV